MAFGFRARLGIICPAPTIMPENEFPPVLPNGVSMCTTRIPLLESSKQGLMDTIHHAYQAADLLVQARVDIIGFLCTMATLVQGNTFDSEFAAKMQEHTGIKTVTTAASAVQALAYLGVKKVVVATPYSSDLNEIESGFLEYHGFEVIAIAGMGLTDPDHIRETTPDAAYCFSRELWDPQADALFFSCTGVPTFNIIELLEEDIGRPVISSNQATLWYMLKSAGVSTSIAGLGQLFSGPP